MIQCSDLERVMETRVHFKNGVSLKSRKSIKYKIAIKKVLIFFAMVMLVMTVHAQRNTFTDAYLKLRQPKEEEGVVVKKLDRKEIQKLLDAPDPEGQTEVERRKFLREKEMMKNAKQFSFILDMEEEGLLSSSQISNLLRPYKELVSMKMEDVRMVVSGDLKKDKIKELIVLIGVDGDGLIFANILFKKPIALQDYMENPEDFRSLISVNAPEGENNNAFFKINFTKSKPSVTIPGLDNTILSTLEVVRVDNKYGVRRTQESDDGEYVIKPTYEIKPAIYGSNPGNTYIMTFSNNYSYLWDKFGFSVAGGDEISPVYVLGNEKEVAAFIIRDRSGYSLYECPETYELIQQGSIETRNLTLRPHIERSIVECQSIVPTEDGRLKCVKADGSIEFKSIRKQNSDNQQANL